MKSAEQRIENQVQFWSMLGPFLLLISIAILLYKLSSHWYFPISALIGIPLCVKWKMKGMAAALGFLFLVSLVSYQSLDIDERYWHVGMGLAMAFSFIILTLSLEEVESLVSKLQRESQSRLDNFLRLDETTKKAETSWFEERIQLSDRAASLAKDLTKVQEDKQIFYKLAQLAKDELIQIRDQHHLLQQELFYKKQQIAQLNERLEESELTVQGFVNSDAEQTIITLTKKLEESLVQQDTHQEVIAHLEALLETQKQEKAKLVEELAQFKEQEHEKSRLETRAEALQNQLDILDKEKEQLQETFTALRMQYEKVLLSEIQHKQSIQTMSQRLVQLEANQDQKERDAIQYREIKQKLESQLSQSEIEFNQRMDQLQRRLAQVEKELSVKQSEIKAQEENLKLAEAEIQRLIEEKENAPVFDPQLIRIESLYKQLRNQFQDKSTVLDQTRHELFKVHEQLLRVQKEREEEHVFDLSEYESLLQREHVKLIRAYENSERIAAAEIKALEDLVGSFLNKSSQ